MDPFDRISLDQLRKRRSEKWATYPPDILPAFVAEMDFALAPPIREAIEAAVELGDVGYAWSTDVPAAFASFVRERFAWNVEERSVFAVPDVMAGVAESLHLLTPPGGSVVINPPVYPPFFDVIPHEGRIAVEVPLRRNGMDWTIDLDALERAFAKGIDAYLLCSPHNPVGRVWTEIELKAIVALCERYRVAIISDEIHAALTMPGVTFVPMLSVTGDHSCIALSSASKAFNIPGLKCAVMVAGSVGVRDALHARLKSRPDEIESRLGHLGVLATIAAFRHGSSWLDGLRAYLDGNRRLLGDLLHERLPGAHYTPPEATYLAWIDCSDLSLGDDPARRFLEHGHVALEPGRKFGTLSADWVRLNMGTSHAMLDEIVKRMATAIA